MSMKKFVYYALLSGNLPGVEQKISNTVEAASEVGYDVDKKIFKYNLSGVLALAKELLFIRNEVVIFRFDVLFTPLLFPFFVVRRLKGARLILDVPTPRYVGLQEVALSDNGFFKIKAITLWAYISWIWVLLPFHRVVQYADESRWFSIGVKRKTVKIGNGIKIDPKLPVKKGGPAGDGLHLIAVANLAPWHGYDRLIRAIAVLKEERPDKKVFLKIVGDGVVLPDLKKLAYDTGVLSQVTFTGLLRGEALDSAFDGMDIGIASLGLFRIGLEEASVLKVREYMVRGLCVIGAGKDPDFTESSKFRLLVSNDESITPIIKILISLNKENLPNPLEVRAYAENNLTLTKKIEQMIG